MTKIRDFADVAGGLTATATELNYSDGVTSDIQTQINGKQDSDAQLTDIAGLTPSAGKFIISDASNLGFAAYTLPTSDGTAGQALTTDGSGAVTFGIPTPTSVTVSGATTDIDFSTGVDFDVLMQASTTFTFSNIAAGMEGVIIVRQNATGGYSFTLPAIAKTPLNGAAIAQTTGANTTSMLSYKALSSTFVMVNYIGDYA